MQNLFLTYGWYESRQPTQPGPQGSLLALVCRFPLGVRSVQVTNPDGVLLFI